MCAMVVLTFTLNLHFEAEYDAYREVKAPCMELQRLDLPYRGTGKAGEWFLSPPGPSPFQFWQPGSKFNGELIHVKIGKLLNIRHAVVKEANVKIFNRFGKGGKMMGGICTLTFETFEIQTKESLNSEVWNGESTVDDSPMTSPPCGTSCG